jgi:hypothetical protein
MYFFQQTKFAMNMFSTYNEHRYTSIFLWKQLAYITDEVGNRLLHSLSLVIDYTTQVIHALVLLSRRIGMSPRRAAGWRWPEDALLLLKAAADWLARAERMNTPAWVVMVILWLYCWLPREKAGGGHRTELSLLFLRHLPDDNGAPRRPPPAPGGRRPRGAPNTWPLRWSLQIDLPQRQTNSKGSISGISNNNLTKI